MALVTNTFLGQAGPPRIAMGSRTGTRTAADFTITVGFMPRYIRVVNLTDRIQAEYFLDDALDGGNNVKALVQVAAGTVTYEDGGVVISSTEGADRRKVSVTIATVGLESDNDDVVWIAMGD